MPHKIPMPNGGFKAYVGKPTYGVLRRDQMRYGYYYKGKNYKVHRLVCEAFNGPPPFDKAIVMHLNDDATNNRPENLAWGTHKENLNTPSFIAYCKSRTAENNPRVKGRRRKAEALAQESMR